MRCSNTDIMQPILKPLLSTRMIAFLYKNRPIIPVSVALSMKERHNFGSRIKVVICN